MSVQLDNLGVDYEYEAYSYRYTEPLRKNMAKCGDCGSTNLRRTGWYTPDFFLGNGIIIEAKGRWTAADRRKMLAMQEEHPDEPIYMLFMRDNKISKRSQTTYTMWCEQNGYKCAVGTVPEEWTC